MRYTFSAYEGSTLVPFLWCYSVYWAWSPLTFSSCNLNLLLLLASFSLPSLFPLVFKCLSFTQYVLSMLGIVAWYSLQCWILHTVVAICDSIWSTLYPSLSQTNPKIFLSIGPLYKHPTFPFMCDDRPYYCLISSDFHWTNLDPVWTNISWIISLLSFSLLLSQLKSWTVLMLSYLPVQI